VSVPFAYYRRLSRARQTIYRQSDAIGSIPLPAGHGLETLADELRAALSEEDRRRVTHDCGALAAGICRHLATPPVRVRVLATRPSSQWEELHGLYRPGDGKRPAEITVWMRTAKRRQVVAFRTFLRTLLHELCHHLDYEHLGLAESFHTAGFYQRESSLFRQLVPGNDKVSR
jgi:hypothetical protein